MRVGELGSLQTDRKCRFQQHTCIAPGRKYERQADNSTITDTGDIYFLDLKAAWENHYPNLSFPQFKYWYFNKNSSAKDKITIFPEICDMFSIRQRVNVETKGDLLLCDLRERLLEDFDYIADTLYATYRKEYFTLDEAAKTISPRYGITKARIIMNSIFHLADPKEKCVKHRSYGENVVSDYILSNGTFKELLNRTITYSTFVKNLSENTNTSISKYMPLSPEGRDALALKMLSVFDYITYEVVGGEEPEIFIRLNDPEKIRRIIAGEIKYSNNYVTRASRSTIIAPISPRCALLFLAKDYPKSFKDSCAIIPDPVEIEQLNIFALKYEYMFNCQFVASDSQLEVEFLQDFQQEHRAELESLKQM